MGKIIWVASYPESGAHWLSVFLANLIADCKKPCSAHDVEMIVPSENSGILNQPFFDRPLREISNRELAEKRPIIHQELAKRAAGYLFLRTHNAALRHFGALTITPEATAAAIYVLRNPLDIAASYGAARGRATDRTIELMAQRGRFLGGSSQRTYQIVGSWSENVASWTSEIRGRVLSVRFEDILEDPEREFSKVVGFLGIDATPEQIARATQNSITTILHIYAKPRRRAEAKKGPLALLRAGAAIAGKRLLTTQHIATIAGSHHDQMKRFGYWR